MARVWIQTETTDSGVKKRTLEDDDVVICHRLRPRAMPGSILVLRPGWLGERSPAVALGPRERTVISAGGPLARVHKGTGLNKRLRQNHKEVPGRLS